MAEPTREDVLSAAGRAVGLACGVCRGLQATLDLSSPIVKKDESPVTVADFASQAIIARTLSAALGPIRLVAEETSAFLRDPAHAPALRLAVEALRPVWPEVTAGAVLGAIDLGSPVIEGTAGSSPPRYFTLDPIDGTKGFLRRRQYSVCLALIVNGTPTIGVLGCPNLSLDHEAPIDPPDGLGSLYVGDAVTGRLRESLPQSGRVTLLRSRRDESPGDRPVRVVTSVEPSHSSHGRLTAVLAALGRSYELVRLDSQCKYALVARGQADALLRLPSRRHAIYHIWDHAPGAAVAAAAGCMVSDMLGRPLDFGAGTTLANNVGILCAAPWLHGPLLEAIERSGVTPAA